MDWKAFQLDADVSHPHDWPKVSIIIPTYNCAQTISLTLESLQEQDYPDYEVIIIDSGSKDRTLEIVKTFPQESIKIFLYPSNQRYEMLNTGISHALGRYINCLFPGDFYISKNTLRQMMSVAIKNDYPHLVYCGTLLRDGRSQVKSLYRVLNVDLLKNGKQPTSLQSCWYRIDTFRELGKFNTHYHLRGSFDLLCRFMKHSDFRFASIYRVLTDYDLRWVTRSMIFRHFWETGWTIKRYYGFFAAMRWLIKQKDGERFFKLWWKSVRIAFFGSERKRQL
ncbi:MAG: glycosyltransferase [Chlamydiales bacterium 38-26]|nr:glycosyltransferase [Chlamydiales bacterium]OJV08608.1 MAG: glycosyltransferase [Chlamydiales bacterium 38-26]